MILAKTPRSLMCAYLRLVCFIGYYLLTSFEMYIKNVICNNEFEYLIISGVAETCNF